MNEMTPNEASKPDPKLQGKQDWKKVRFCDDVEIHYVPSRTLWQRTKASIKHSPQHIKDKVKSTKESMAESYHVMVELLT